MTNKELGEYGESLARIHLEKSGHEILHCNYRNQRAEIDIVSRFDEKIVVTEVKTRQTAEIGEPYLSVTKAKQKQIIKAANLYILEFDIHEETRFDIVSIVHNSFGTRLEHIENAFTT